MKCETKAPWSPDFNQLLRVLDRKLPDRPVLFELFVADAVVEYVLGASMAGRDKFERDLMTARAYERLGYDYTLIMPSGFHFETGDRDTKASFSLNAGAVITDRASFDRYVWPHAPDYDYSFAGRLKEQLPESMGILVWSSDGPLETVVRLVGYENLCYMLYDDEPLLSDIFEQVGRRIVEDYTEALKSPAVGGVVVGDDWGFNTQTMLPAWVYRKYLFPWHKKIVRMAHASGRPAILHSCGKYEDVLEDIIDDMGYDARHSYEDNIVSVEQAYAQLHKRMAVLGGLDVHFLATASKEAIFKRAYGMLEQSAGEGAYALGSGNSIPDYIPVENYLTMLEAAYQYYLK